MSGFITDNSIGYAYKAFHSNLSCTLGKGTFEYQTDIWYEEEEAMAHMNGFHTAGNPFDCLRYYPWDGKNRFFKVCIGGQWSEDGTDSKISSTKLYIPKKGELSILRFLVEGLKYTLANEKLEISKEFHKEKGETHSSPFVLVAGYDPIAKGTKVGDYLAFYKKRTPEHPPEIGLLQVDGKTILPNEYYDIDANKRGN